MWGMFGKLSLENQLNDWYRLKELLWDISSEKDPIVKLDMRKIYMEMLTAYENNYKIKFLVNERPKSI